MNTEYIYHSIDSIVVCAVVHLAVSFSDNTDRKSKTVKPSDQILNRAGSEVRETGPV